MGSIFARSEIQKNKMDECTATGLYPFLVSSIIISVCEAISCLAAISWERDFEEDRILMAVSSSRMLPWGRNVIKTMIN